ncbi:MAG: hypothetical protein IKC88_05600 [Opitutales bacterium]|nr:hypothetical protein [Opitutales bacterium]
MSDETNPIQPQEIPSAPTMRVAPAEPQTVRVEAPVAPTPVETPVAPVAPAPVAKPVASAPTAPVAKPVAPAVKPAVSLDLPKTKYGVATKAGTATPMKTVEVKKDENPSIVSVAIDFVAAAVAVAFAVMIILDI